MYNVSEMTDCSIKIQYPANIIQQYLCTGFTIIFKKFPLLEEAYCSAWPTGIQARYTNIAF
jgi:hypothetical protein